MRADLIERLRKDALGCGDEDVMRRWDAIHRMCVEGGHGSHPRDCFESIIDGYAENAAEAADALAALQSAQAQGEGWSPIETAPHDEHVLLGWWYEHLPGEWDWQIELDCASHGWRRGSISNISRHGSATHWMPLPLAPPRIPARETGDDKG